MWWLVASALAGDPTGLPTDQTLVYYNARLALREGDPLTAAKFWFLRNAIEDETGRVSEHDPDFGSVTWAALGDLGICPDGQPTDEEGSGLWPLSLHNWVVRNRNRRSIPKPPNPYRAFDVGRQARYISIEDVLSADEMRTISLVRGRCLRPRLSLLDAGETLQAKLTDRAVAARLLRHLLEQGRSTMDRDRVRGVAAIDARLFDLDLKITELAAREARKKARKQALTARRRGLSRESVSVAVEEAPKFAFRNSRDAKLILRQSRDWPVSEWMTLSSERRRFLYDKARSYVQDPEAFDGLALGIIDALIERGEGADVALWIPRYAAGLEPIWSGERGRRLLALDDESGFRERSVVALHRGVRFLEQGLMPEALTAFAFSLQNAAQSQIDDEVQSLSLRWMSYVASQFELTDDLLATLEELVPRREYTVILEDLMWSAAFRADRRSFDRGRRRQPGRGALVRRMDLLLPLAMGDVPRFTAVIRQRLEESPSETIRFLDQFVQRLELEDSGLRAAHVETLTRIRTMLEPIADPQGDGRSRRRAEALLDRTLSIIDGVGGLGDAASSRDRARDLDPSGTVFAGSVRLAPSDPLPWPFRIDSVSAPSIFQPLKLRPVEWQDPDGSWVFGWSIEG
ncbi:MAG: hypothetical protein AAGA48_22340 [Myxococcota bacterium]